MNGETATGPALRQKRRIGVYGVATDDADRVLLVRGSSASFGPGAWMLPGGGVRHGEDPRAALVREFEEETGLSVFIQRVREAITDFDVLVDEDRVVQHDRLIFDVRVVGGRLRGETGGMTDRAEWVDRKSLPVVALRPWVAGLLGARSYDLPELPASQPPVDLGDYVQRFSVYGVARDPAGRILLTRISEGYPGAGSWHLPGGGTDFGEAAADALHREMQEETGQEGVVGELLAIEHTHNPRAFGPEQRHIDWHTIRTIFRVTVPKPTTPTVYEQDGSTDRAGWFALDELRKLPLNKFARVVIGEFGR